MNGKKLLSVILSLLVIFSLTSCNSNENTTVTQTDTTFVNDVINENITESVLNTEPTIFNTTAEYNIQEYSQPQSPETTNSPTETETTTTEKYDDPANWSKKQIVEEYKKAAQKSAQSISIKKISVNDGEHENVMSFITSIIAKFLESNSTEKDGITGGYENLVPKDVNSAKAYTSGNDTVIEMLMVEQISGAKEDALSGSVGHAITTVGDIGEVVKDLADRGLPLELSEEDTKIYYTNPVVKVTINDNNEIVSGTWSYTVEISMNNFKAFGQNVAKASIIMENTITV